MAQLFGKQKNFESPPTISNRARENDILGTNFLAFKALEKQTLERFEEAQGWGHSKAHNEKMQATRDLQAFTSRPFNAAIRENSFSNEDFFDKPGHYKFMYGPAKYGIANPVAAGIDYNIDSGRVDRKAEQQLGYKSADSGILREKEQFQQNEEPQHPHGRKDQYNDRYRNPMFVSAEHNVGRSSFTLPVPDPADPYMSYGLRESSNWVKRDNFPLSNSNPASGENDAKRGVCLPGWTMRNGTCYAGSGIVF